MLTPSLAALALIAHAVDLPGDPPATQPSAPTAPQAQHFDARDFGAHPANTDNAPAIQAAIDKAARAGGGTVRVPPAETPYTIRDAIRISADNIRLVGPGATIRFADNAMNGEIIDCIEIAGADHDPAENVAIHGLTIDANYWNQPGSYNPRGIDSDNATGLLIEGVTITNAFVGLTFGKGVHHSVARDCTITNWYDDAFNASGDGVSGSCTHNAFIGCVARHSPDERAGGKPGTRNNAWEIEDGAQHITLTRCVVEHCGGNGFAARNHPADKPVATGPVRFEHCRADNVARNAFSVFGQTFPNTVSGISLEHCSSDSACVFYKDIRGLTITSSSFSGTVTMGPIRDGTIRDSSFNHLRIWSTAPGKHASEGSYETAITFTGCVIQAPPSVFGRQDSIRFVDTPRHEPAQ